MNVSQCESHLMVIDICSRKSENVFNIHKKPISCSFGNQLCYIRIDIELGDLKVMLR